MQSAGGGWGNAVSFNNICILHCHCLCAQLPGEECAYAPVKTLEGTVAPSFEFFLENTLLKQTICRRDREKKNIYIYIYSIYSSTGNGSL